MQDSYERTVTDADIQQFAEVSGDHNPVHLNADFAAATRFKARIAHGMLSAAFISMVVGTKLPEPGSIYVSQTLKFRAPVYIGDTVVTTVTVTDINEKKGFVTLNSVYSVEGKDVVRDESIMMVAKQPSV